MLKYDIVIPSWNQNELVISCLNSIHKHSEDYRVIFVDNCSDKKELEKIIPVLEKIPHLYLRNETNLGFVKATNIGLKNVKAPYVILLNNDTEVAESWLEKLIFPFSEDSKIGIVGPLSSAKAQWQSRYELSTGYDIIPFKKWLAFFCVALRKEMMDSIGLLDESFGQEFCDDLEYCLRAQKKGWKLALIKDLRILHHHRNTFYKLYKKEEVDKMLISAAQKYDKMKKDLKV